jgi:hypothetical protein
MSALAADGPEKKKPDAPPPAERNEDREASPGDYWLGIMGTPVDALLKSHLKIDGGVVIEHIVPNSPASKAGVQENDILTEFGDAKVSDVETLAQAVAKSQDKPANVTVIREGQEKTLSVTPERRPDSPWVDLGPPRPFDREQFSEWLKKLEKGEIPGDPMRMWFVHPGIVVDKALKDGAVARLYGAMRLPNGMSVTVAQPDSGPAKITVRKGDETWEATENELDKLPEDVRPFVRRMLQSPGIYGPGGLRLEWRNEPWRAPGGVDVKPDVKPGKPSALREDLQKKLEDVTRQVRENEKRLQRELDELRQQLEKMKPRDN